MAEDAEREFLFYGDPSAGFSPEDVDFNAIAKAKLVHFGSIGLIPEQSCAATLDAVDAASGHGLHVSFDANLRLDLWPRPTPRAKRSLRASNAPPSSSSAMTSWSS